MTHPSEGLGIERLEDVPVQVMLVIKNKETGETVDTIFFAGTKRNKDAAVKRLSNEYRVEEIKGHNFERIGDERAELVRELESRFASTDEVRVPVFINGGTASLMGTVQGIIDSLPNKTDQKIELDTTRPIETFEG